MNMSRLPIPSFEGMALLNETNSSDYSEEEDTEIMTQPRDENEQSSSAEESKEQRSPTTTARASKKRKHHASSDEESQENSEANPVQKTSSSSPSTMHKRKKKRRDKRRKEPRNAKTQLFFDEGQMKTIDEILATREWAVDKILGKRTVGRGSNKRTEYRCQWRNTLETEAMYLALKNYKGIGYKVRVENVQAAAGGEKLYNCCWGALWEPEEHLNSTAVSSFEKEQEQKKQRRKPNKPRDPRGYEDV